MSEQKLALLKLWLRAAVRKIVFTEAQAVCSEPELAREALEAAEDCQTLSKALSLAEDAVTPGLVINGSTRGHFTFGLVTGAGHGGVLEGVGPEDLEKIRTWMNSVIANARGVWDAWARTRQVALRPAFDPQRAALVFAGAGKTEVALGFAFTPC